MDAVPGADDAPSPAGDPGPIQAHPERHPDDLSPADLPTGRPRPAIPSGILWALALAVVVLAIASWVAFSTDKTTTEPDARLTDPNATLALPDGGLSPDDVTGEPITSTGYTTFDGSTSSVTAYAGTPLVVNFWASSCAPCITEMPALERVHQAAGDQVAFIGLAVADQETAARDLAERTGVSYELGFDPTSRIIRESGGAFLPTTVFVDASGAIVESHVGVIEEAELRDKLQTHFGISVPPGS